MILSHLLSGGFAFGAALATGFGAGLQADVQPANVIEGRVAPGAIRVLHQEHTRTTNAAHAKRSASIIWNDENAFGLLENRLHACILFDLTHDTNGPVDMPRCRFFWTHSRRARIGLGLHVAAVWSL